MKITELKKLFNQEFPRAAVKAEGLDGKFRSTRDGYGKMIRLIPTYVQLSPIDCTDVKANKVEAKFQEMLTFLKGHGGYIRVKSSQHAIVEFIDAKGKGFTVHFYQEKHRATYLYDEGYKNVFFDVRFEKV